MDAFIKQKLLNLYPSKIVVSLHQKHPSLYAQVKSCAKERGISTKDYLGSLGFEWRRKQSTTMSLEDIKVRNENLYKEINALLLEKFPNKEIPRFSDIPSSTNNLILRLCREENVKRTALVRKLGFNVATSGGSYDIIAMKKLYEDFSCNQSTMARWFGVSREAIRQKVTQKANSTANWIVEDLDERGYNILNELLKKRVFSYEDDDIVFEIFNNQDGKVAIFYKYLDAVSVLFELPQKISDMLASKGYDRYSQEELQLMETLKEHIVYDNFTRVKDSELQLKIRNAGSRRGMSVEAFTEFLGYRRLHPNKITRAELKETLKQFVVEGNMVHIPCDDPFHYKMANRASRAGYPSLEAFVKSFDFEYTSYYKEYMYQRNLSIFKEEIKRYIVKRNQIYIKSQDPIYVRLHNFAFKRGLKLNEVIEDLGYKRIHLEELPNDFVPYDWRNDYKISVGEGTEDRYIEMLKQYVIEEGSNKVYIYTGDPIYSRLYDIAVRKNMTVNELLYNWGYERYYRPQLDPSQAPYDWRKDLEQDDEDEDSNIPMDREDHLEKLKDIQTVLEVTEVTEQRVKRSRALANELKKLYDYKCQICDYEGEHIPLIETDNGKYYAEVHHIRKISGWLDINEEEENLDSYLNVICLCAHHHKVVHYGNGGYDQLHFDEENGLHFLSKNGGALKVITNYHLQVEGMDEHLSLCDEILVLEEELEVWGEEMYESWAETNKPTSAR
ncbi:HNH endonuclease [Bacillus cereus]|uniref:HNH endonuclease n=1 Tax=Bacillus cereus TaxID=1396 RepID=UPI00356DA230